MPAKKPARRPDPDEEEDPGFEVVEDEEPAPRPKPAKSAKLKKKKKLKRRAPVEEEDDYAKSLRHFEYIGPAIVLAVGVVLTFVGAYGAAKGASGAVNVVAVMLVGMLISIPLTIGALMVAGMILGIEYGRFAPAILKIAAITFVANGVLWVGDWAKLPSMLTFPVSCLISFGLFMTLFDLDTWETNASMGVVNVLTFIGHVVIAMFLVAAEAKHDRKKDRDLDRDDDTPGNVQPRQKGRPGPQHDPDDDGPDDPPDDPEG
jgi:hypothetical protein